MRIVMIGAGSAFGSRLSVDILSRQPLRDATICLCDIDADKLETVRKYVQKVIDSNNLPAKVETSTNREELLPGADAVVLSVAIGGPAYYDHPYDTELAIAEKHGICSTVADTVGIGGVFRTLRTAPEMLRMMDDINRLAPGCIVLNYTNPMAMLTWLFNDAADNGVQVVGLCHSVQGTAKKLAGYIGVDYDEINYWCAGINHMSWYMRFRRGDEDLYPLLRKAMNDPKTSKEDEIRFEVMRYFDYFVTESSRHMCEYVPWYQHEQDRMKPYAEITRGVKANRHAYIKDMGIKAEDLDSIELVRSHEYASAILEARLTNVPMSFNGNVMNDGLITNLPQGCCVEVPCLTDADGVHPCYVGDLPAQCAALCRTNVNVQEMAVKAVQQRSREAALQAVLLDPSVGAVCSLSRAKAMFDEMWEAEGELLADY